MKQLKWLLVFGILLTSQAFAEGAAPNDAKSMDSGMAQILLLAAFALIFYFIIIRPQGKRAKEHQQLVSGVEKGDEIITTGGILGKITRVTDSFFIVKVAEGVEISIQKQAVATIVPKETLKTVSSST